MEDPTSSGVNPGDETDSAPLAERDAASDSSVDPESPSEPQRESQQGLKTKRNMSAALVVAVGAAILPIVVATVRALARGWMPISENALFELRARDFLTSQTPLLGTASSISITSGTALNHPGPILFEWLAIPVRVLGGHAGVAVGVALLNIAAIVVAAVFARRVGGDQAAIVVAVGAALVGWIMGSELLFDPWNPNVLMLSAYAFIVVTWSLANGHGSAWPWAAVFASICLQTHLSYVYLVPIVLLGAFLIGRSRPTRRQVSATVAVLFVAWLPPIIEQVLHGRRGNMWGLARAATHGDGTPIGLRLGTRLVAAVLTRPPWQARSGFATAVPPTGYDAAGHLPAIDTMGLASAAIRLTVLVAALIALWIWARHRDTILARTAQFSLVVIAAAWFSVTRMPIGAIGLSPHQMRWLWSIAGWLVAVFCLTTVRVALRCLGKTRLAQARLAFARGFAVLTVVIALCNLATYTQPAGPALVAWRIPSVKTLTGQTVASLIANPPTGAIWVDTRDIPYFDVYYQSVMVALDEAGFEFQVDDPIQLRQVGPGRTLDDSATVRLHLRFGVDAFDPAPNETVIATYGELPAEQVKQVTASIGEIRSVIATDGIALTPAGQDAAATQQLGFDPDVLRPRDVPGGRDVADPLPISKLITAWQSGFLVTDPMLQRDLETIAAVTPDAGQEIAVVVSPIEATPGPTHESTSDNSIVTTGGT